MALDESQYETRNYTSEDLWRENEAYARAVIPSMVFVALLMVVGVVGNGLAVYIFGVRLRVATQHFLIVCLALCDLLLNLIAMPTEIADLRYHLAFSSDFACRLLRFVTMFGALTSNCILVVIAVDRYRRVCHPLRRQLTIREARIGAGLSALVGLLISWPAFVLTGLKTAETSLQGLYGKECSFSDHYRRTVYPLILLALLGAGFLIMTLVLTVLYARIWWQARTHRSGKHFKSRPRQESRTSTTVSPPGSPTSHRASFSESAGQTCPMSLSSPPSVWNEPFSMCSAQSVGEGPLSVIITGSDNPKTQTDEGSTEQQKQTTTKWWKCCPRMESKRSLDKKTSEGSTVQQKETTTKRWKCCPKKGFKWGLDKTTLVAFAVTLVFVVSYLPYLVLMLVRRVLPWFSESMKTSVQLNVYNIFLRFYFLNSAANPVIYGLFNARFRQECVTLFRRFQSAVCCCCAYVRNGGKTGS